MVDSAAATVDAIVANGCEIVRPIGADAPEITARFRDPAGNVLGIYQNRADGARQPRLRTGDFPLDNHGEGLSTH